MTESSATEKERRTSRSWCSERFLQAFAEAPGFDSALAAGAELVRKRRVFDFFVAPGRVTAKVQEEDERSSRVEIGLSQFSDLEWNAVFRELALQAIHLAKLLSGRMAREVEDAAEKAGCRLFPSSFAEFDIRVNGEKPEQLEAAAGAVLSKLFSQLDSMPFTLFLIRGRGRDETLFEIRRHRAELRRNQPAAGATEQKSTPPKPPAPLIADPARFWTAGSGIEQLSFSLKADELPAFILKRLNPVPVGVNLEEQVDFALEEAYALIARRAQAFGFGLASK